MSAAPPDEEGRAALELSLLPGVGPVRAKALVGEFDSAAGAMRASDDRVAALVGRAAAEARRSPEVRERAEAALARAAEAGMRILPRGAPGWPPPLDRLTDPPPFLFLRGDADLLGGPAVAIVGSRRATEAGRRVAGRIAAVVAGAGAAVVSGLALGIDGAAHRGCLRAGGRTVAVLGCGADVEHPPSNRRLFRQIARDGLLVSEFLPGEMALPHHFPQRNRILAALARAVVVVEAAERSGALITVDHAVDLGLDVLAVPGSVESRQSRGTNALIRDGARVLTDAEALLEELPWLAELRAPEPARAGRSGPEGFGPDVAAVWRALAAEPRGVDDVASHAGVSTERTLAALTALEVEGWAARVAGLRFHRGQEAP